MRLEDYEILAGMLQELIQEMAQIERQIYCNTREIKETDACLKTFTDSEPDDMKVFSPRKVDILYKEEIEKIKEQKTQLEERNQELIQKKSLLDGRVGRLKNVLENQKRDFSSRIELARELHKTSVEDLKSLAQRIEKNCEYINQNPIQAKQDLILVAKRLKETAERMKDAVHEE